ncbi:hypothetical protein CKALI_07830 [Corynebacterium kalinowskii]|uniref:DoxX family membrane protein n=1 Tax=Corynebacterium kalinowskii TaxID=2675216 RepID=A0A6B8W4V9_9CORY|nr:hypothetical protein [Corynebacterium kalinowskii]QGU02428.1 hypothetical protein CKALI_07830 [Corynebacterium kalinowskii]
MKTLVRWGFGAIFAAGVAIHLYYGQTQPEGYAAFGETAVPPVDQLWRSFVMPHIRVLTVAMAAIEAFIAIGLLWQEKLRKPAVITSLAFFGCLIPLGFGWPTATLTEDFLKNRLGSVLMILAMAPLLSASGMGGRATG